MGIRIILEGVYALLLQHYRTMALNPTPSTIYISLGRTGKRYRAGSDICDVATPLSLDRCERKLCYHFVVKGSPSEITFPHKSIGHPEIRR